MRCRGNYSSAQFIDSENNSNKNSLFASSTQWALYETNQTTIYLYLNCSSLLISVTYAAARFLLKRDHKQQK